MLNGGLGHDTDYIDLSWAKCELYIYIYIGIINERQSASISDIKAQDCTDNGGHSLSEGTELEWSAAKLQDSY